MYFIIFSFFVKVHTYFVVVLKIIIYFRNTEMTLFINGDKPRLNLCKYLYEMYHIG